MMPKDTLGCMLDQLSTFFWGDFQSFLYAETRKLRKNGFVRLFAARDLMRDTQQALHSDINQCEGTRLGVFGFMQALYLQEQSLEHIYECIVGEKFPKQKYEALVKIRYIRDKIIGGHPLDSNKQKPRYNVLGPSFDQGWKIDVSDHADFKEHSTYDLIILRDEQEKEIKDILKNLILCIENKINIHKEKFMNNRLSDLFKGLTLSHIIEAVEHPDKKLLAVHDCNILKKQAQEFLEKLEERSEGIRGFNVEEFIWGLSNILQYIDDKPHAYLLWRGLNVIFSDLKDYANQIDEKYINR